MSLLRLLTAGKSLVGIRDYRSRYVARAGMLPRFGSKKNPFRATVKPELGKSADPSRSMQSGALTPQEDQVTEVSPSAQPGNEESRETQDSANRTGAEGAGGQRSVSPGAKRYASRMDTSFDWSKVLFWRRPKAAHQAVPRFSKPLVQGELSLDGVKVVRNDLSDSDLEIVPAKSRPTTPTAEAVTSSISKDGTSETAWGRVAGRLFGASKT